MKKLNGKTGLSRRVGAIASVITTLGAAAVVAMAPVSQAQAVGLVVVSGGTCSLSSKGTRCSDIGYRAEGGARGNVGNAKADARKRAVCASAFHYINGSARWGQMGRWKDWDWYYADINFKCAYGIGNRNVTGI